MTGKATFKWDGAKFKQHVYAAAERTLMRLSVDGQTYWQYIAPIGKSSAKHEAGELRDSWFAYVTVQEDMIVLVIGASARYAIYVELGTTYMQPQAPIRTTAAELTPLIPIYLEQEMAVA